jgi:hypothetical protein
MTENTARAFLTHMDRSRMLCARRSLGETLGAVLIERQDGTAAWATFVVRPDDIDLQLRDFTNRITMPATAAVLSKLKPKEQAK